MTSLGDQRCRLECLRWSENHTHTLRTHTDIQTHTHISASLMYVAVYTGGKRERERKREREIGGRVLLGNMPDICIGNILSLSPATGEAPSLSAPVPYFISRTEALPSAISLPVTL